MNTENLAEQIETAVKAKLSAVSYDYATTVKEFRQGGSDAEYPSIVVQTGPINYGPIVDVLWDVIVTAHCLTYTADDTNQAVLSSIYDSTFRKMVNISNADLQAELTDIDVHGIFLNDTEASIEDNVQRQAVSMMTRVHAELATVSTTTTTTT